MGYLCRASVLKTQYIFISTARIITRNKSKVGLHQQQTKQPIDQRHWEGERGCGSNNNSEAQAIGDVCLQQATFWRGWGCICEENPFILIMRYQCQLLININSDADAWSSSSINNTCKKFHLTTLCEFLITFLNAACWEFYLKKGTKRVLIVVLKI